MYRIGETAKVLGVSADTLRYYEKERLLPRVARNAAGRRLYGAQDFARVRFIRRAQRMNFTLAEIGTLLALRDAPNRTRADVQRLAKHKLADIEQGIAELTMLRDELRSLVNRCADSTSGCPIIDGLDRVSERARSHRVE